MKLTHDIQQAFRLHKNKPALSRYITSKSFQTISYGELDAKVHGVARFLSEHGMKPGDLVASYMNKSIDLAVVILATIINGGVACALNPRFKSHQVVTLASVARPKFIIVDKNTSSSLAHVSEAALGSQVVLHAEHMEIIQLSKAGDFHNAVKGKGVSLPSSYHADDAGYCLFTSGSTGEQKGVLISRDDLLERVKTEIEDYQVTCTDHLLSLLPFSFDVGLNQFLSSILSGSHLVILNSWFPKDVIAAIRLFEITGISAVPTIWADMLCYPKERSFGEDIKTLRYITVSGGDLAQKYLVQLKQYFEKVDIYKTYGQSETFRSGILKPRDFSNKMTSVGQPVKGTRIFILQENGHLAPPDGEGEIIHYGAGTMIRYINNGVVGAQEKLRDIPESLRSTLREGKVVYTGDRGKIDSEGFLYVLGREDGMIKTLGFRVYPREVENCILGHTLVKHAAVVGISDNRKGQSLIAEIVAKDTLDEGEVTTYIRERLPYYMVPDEIYIVDSLPLAENGKIRYAEIKAKHEQR
ncbi:MAG TPA: class I adenylate-forming enzyme family protein [Nitrospirota bacterium]|nr:class I adenylate-forming enzyme family protein [Nitrospirota bacterium]